MTNSHQSFAWRDAQHIRTPTLSSLFSSLVLSILTGGLWFFSVCVSRVFLCSRPHPRCHLVWLCSLQQEDRGPLWFVFVVLDLILAVLWSGFVHSNRRIVAPFGLRSLCVLSPFPSDSPFWRIVSFSLPSLSPWCQSCLRLWRAETHNILCLIALPWAGNRRLCRDHEHRAPAGALATPS